MTGGSVTLIGSGAVVVAAEEIEAELQALLVSAVSVDDCLGAIVAALSSHVRTLPSLVCAIQEPDGVRILLRGTAEAVVTTEAGEQRLAPGSVSTWAEHMIPGAASLVLRHAPDGSPAILPGGPRIAPRLPAAGAAISAGPATAPPGAAQPTSAQPTSAQPISAQPAPPQQAAPTATPAGAAGDGLALASSTLAWLGEGAAAGADGAAQAGGGPAAEPLPPSADAPDEALDGVGDPLAAEPDPPSADEAAEVDDPFGFAHLLGETLHVSTEEAAVRPPPEDHEDDEPAPAPPAAAPVVPPAEPEPPTPPAIPLPVMTGGGLIDSVPGSAVQPAAQLGEPPRPAATAQLTPVNAGPPSSPRPLAGPGAPFASAASRPPVQAVLCDLGHPNPVIASECRTCGHQLLDRTPRSLPRPSLGRLVFTDGMVAELDSPVLIGRAPAESMAAPDLREPPKLLSLPSQDKRISRLHAEIRLEGWQVYVLDSSSLNGTTVMQPGLPPRQLRSGEPCLIDPGTSVNLGGAVTFTYEGPSSR